MFSTPLQLHHRQHQHSPPKQQKRLRTGKTTTPLDHAQPDKLYCFTDANHTKLSNIRLQLAEVHGVTCLQIDHQILSIHSEIHVLFYGHNSTSFRSTTSRNFFSIGDPHPILWSFRK
uniref:Uncharacterized protein n=1 Tax=Arundo donax TaxID=35708 RepID=A0A0A9HGP6_ARUDO